MFIILKLISIQLLLIIVFFFMSTMVNKYNYKYKMTDDNNNYFDMFNFENPVYNIQIYISVFSILLYDKIV